MKYYNISSDKYSGILYFGNYMKIEFLDCSLNEVEYLKPTWLRTTVNQFSQKLKNITDRKYSQFDQIGAFSEGGGRDIQQQIHDKPLTPFKFRFLKEVICFEPASKFNNNILK